ncbi:MAG: hypothetical protein DMG64_15210, partial [Acidobacteria bacterium]
DLARTLLSCLGFRSGVMKLLMHIGIRRAPKFRVGRTLMTTWSGKDVSLGSSVHPRTTRRNGSGLLVG